MTNYPVVCVQNSTYNRESHILSWYKGDFMYIWEKCMSYIRKDTAGEDQSNGTAVLLRAFIISMAFYLLTEIAVFLANHDTQFLPFAVVLLVCYVVAFLYTYRGKTLVTLWTIQILTLLWIILSVLMMGWNCGVQHFIFVLLALSLVTGYQDLKIKVIMSAVYCAIRLILYYYTLHRVAFYPLTRKESAQFQVINTVGIFLQMTVLIIAYSKETQATEQKLVKYNKKIKELADTDALTRLLNRRAMVDRINHYVAEHADHPCFCIAISDIDYFKKVNDTYGHDAGDEVLRKVAAKLTDFMKGKGYVARWGGEEFLFLFKNGNGDEVFAELDRLRREIAKMGVVYNEQQIVVHMTFGLQEYDSDKPIDATITKAYEKLYSGKLNGRNRVVF